jgi:hypothetical protein
MRGKREPTKGAPKQNVLVASTGQQSSISSGAGDWCGGNRTVREKMKNWLVIAFKK